MTDETHRKHRIARVAAVLFDRDGTLIVDRPYNGDPALVIPMPGARDAVQLLLGAGVRTGVVSNQSAVGRGTLTMDDVKRVNRRVDTLVGPLRTWHFCPHVASDGCLCRKPKPGLVLDACEVLGVPPTSCVVIGDTGADVGAALAAGARSILVPTSFTRPDEVEAAGNVQPDVLSAARLVLEWRDECL